MKCLTKGLVGVKGLAVMFRRMDTDMNKCLNWDEFKRGMQFYGVDIHETDLKALFDTFDKDSNGQVDFRE